MSNETNCTRLEEEHRKLYKIINFRLPHKYKIIGLLSALLVFVFLLASKFLGSNSLLVKDVSRSLMLVFMLIATLSQEKVEDEYVNHIRFQSYVLAFVCAVSYSIALPLISFVLDILITKITGDGSINYSEVSAFEVMFMLLGFQLLFFKVLKRFGRA